MCLKTPAQKRVFEKYVVFFNESHIQRYLQTYLPDAGFEYAITYRYRTARLERVKALEKYPTRVDTMRTYLQIARIYVSWLFVPTTQMKS